MALVASVILSSPSGVPPEIAGATPCRRCLLDHLLEVARGTRSIMKANVFKTFADNVAAIPLGRRAT